MWSKGEFRDVLLARKLARSKLSSKAQSAALHFARWQGLTEEPDVTCEGAKGALDDVLAAMDEDDWEELKAIAPDLGDTIYHGLLRHHVDQVAKAMEIEAKAHQQDDDDAYDMER